jgi:hypothetical protein
MIFKQTGVESISARSEYVAIDPDGKKLTSSTGTSEGRHKDGNIGSELFSTYCCHFRSVSHYIDTVFAIDIKADFVAT